jgi:hypothetical protein
VAVTKSDSTTDTPRAISLSEVDRLLRVVIQVSRLWTALVLGAAVLSAFSLTFKDGQLEFSIQITPITVLLIALIWLPAIVNVVALAGGGIKTPAGEVQSSGLLQILRSLEPAAQRGALPAVIAALDTGPTRDDPDVAELRQRLQGQLAGLPVEAAVARERLNSLAREYETIRATMPGGPDRTFKMTQIVTEARGLAQAARLDPQSLTGLFQGPDEGDRIVTLAIIEANPDPVYLPIVFDAIENARSPFEQYHGLLAGLAMVDELSADQRAALREAIKGRMGLHLTGVAIDRRDPGRLLLAKQLIAATGG